MNIVKLLQEGNHQIIVLPEDYHLQGDEVYIKKVGNAIVIISKDNPWQSLFNSLDLFSEDFMESREEPNLHPGEDLFE